MDEARDFLNGRVLLYGGDCLDVLASLPSASVDSIVTDPPYHLTSIVKRFSGDGAKPVAAGAKAGRTGAYKRASAGFMGKTWDGGDIAFRPDVWRQCLRVLKPGGYLLAFASTRGFGRMQVAIEEAGFITHPLFAELRATVGLEAFLATLDEAQVSAFWQMVGDADPGGMVAWVFGQGFPKAHDAAKAIDRHLETPGTIAPKGDPVRRMRPGADQQRDGSWEKSADRDYQPGEYVPGSAEAAAWSGFAYGGQALKPAIEPIYMGQTPFSEKNGAANILKHGTGALNIDACRVGTRTRTRTRTRSTGQKISDNLSMAGGNYAREPAGLVEGRWPANLIHDGSDEVVSAFPDAPGAQRVVDERFEPKTGTAVYGDYGPRPEAVPRGDCGSAARFFYSAKADASDRIGSRHPTVKPVDLMRYLVRLVTPPGGTVLDPFAGTGTTGEAAWREGFSSVLIEREAESLADIAERMRLCLAGPVERRQAIARRRGDVAEDAGPLFGGAAEPVAGGGEA